MTDVPSWIKIIVEAALSYIDVFENIIQKYLSDTQNTELFYDCNEINIWLETLVSDINFKLTPELVNDYMKNQYRPCISELYHQYCHYLITTKKCFEINNKEEKEVIQNYCLELLFKHINSALKSKLMILETIDLKKYKLEQLKLDFHLFREDLKNNIIDELIKNNNFILLPVKDEVISYNVSDKKNDVNYKTPRRNNSLSLLIENFDNLFISATNGTNITRKYTIDSESGDMIEEFVVDRSPATITAQLPSPLGKFG